MFGPAISLTLIKQRCCQEYSNKHLIEIVKENNISNWIRTTYSLTTDTNEK